MAKYIDMTHHKGTSLTQHGREEGIRRLMSINLLKRLESSVYSFWLTIERIKMLIDSTIEMIDRYQSGNLVFDLTEITDSEDFDYGMIDGYINNGSKSAERSSKASIMERLKAAKSEPQKDNPTPHKEPKKDREL